MKIRFSKLFMLAFFFLLLTQQAALISTNNCVNAETVEQSKTKDGSEFIDSLVKSANELTSYTCNFDMTVYKNNSVIKEAGYIYFKKPRLLRNEITAGPKKGSVAVLCKDGKIRAHYGGLLKFAIQTLPPDSEMASAANGYLMKDSDYLSLAQYLKNMLKAGDRSAVSVDPVSVIGSNQMVYKLEVFGKRDNKEMLIKRVLVSTQTNIPVAWEDYRNGTLYSTNSWHNLKTNVDLKDQLFQM